MEAKLAATGILLFLAHYAVHSKKCFVSLIHSDSLYLRRPICCPYFLEFGFRKKWILLLILLSKRFGEEKKEHSSIFAVTLGKICRYLICEEKILFSLPVWFPFSQKEKLFLKKRSGGGKHNYYSTIIWKRPWEEHFPLQELLVTCLSSWHMCLPAPSILSFPIMLPGA